MSYKTYTTEAIVCGTFDRNTADRSYLLFTRDAGMLYATARSAREEKSRQRYALQDFSHIKVSLVKGKSGWRVGSVTGLANHFNEATDKAARGSVARVYRLLRRFVQGEEVHQDLFDETLETLHVLVNPLTERAFVEEVLLVRLLALLGYVDRQKIPAAIRAEVPAKIATHFDPHTQAQVTTLLTQAQTASQL